MNPASTTPRSRFVGETNFEAVVLESSKPLLVAFVAPWSRPCQLMLDTLLELEQSGVTGVEIVVVNADDNPRLSLCYAVQNIPTLLYFESGIQRARLVGTVSKDVIVDLLSPLATRHPDGPSQAARS